MKRNCLICSIPNYEFERRAKGFDHNVKLEDPMFDYHVKYEHNMWDYIYFHLYLERIDVNDQSAIESYVYRKINEKEIDMFPLFQARSLKAIQDDTSTELAELRKMMKETMNHFQEEVKIMQENTSTQLDELREMMRNVMQHLQHKEKGESLHRKGEEDAP